MFNGFLIIYRFNFDSLKTVHSDLIIEQCTFCDPGRDYATEFTPNASFPALQSAGFVRIAGMFSE